MEQIHKEMLIYFWRERGDIKRYRDFEKIKSILQEEYPELFEAIMEYEKAFKKLDESINLLEEE